MATIPIGQLPPDLVYNGQVDVSNPTKQAKYDQLNAAYNTPSSAADVTPFLNSFQSQALQELQQPQTRDASLDLIVGKYAPELAGSLPQGEPLYTVPTSLEGKTLRQLTTGGNSLGFNPDEISKILGITQDTPLTAGQTFAASKFKGEIMNQQANKLFGAAASPAAPNVTPVTAPTPINRVAEFEKQRAAMGVADLESFVNDLKAQERDLYADLKARQGAERGKSVPLGVITGRISKEEQQTAERLDTITRAKATAVDELNTKYNVINTMINFMGLDYNDAVTAYNSEFQRNIQIAGLISDAKNTAFQQKATIAGLEMQQQGINVDIAKTNQQIASANLTTMMNALTSGNANYSTLTPETKALITKLELQAGLPAGFTSSLGLSTKDKMLFTSTNEGITQVGFLQEDGSIKVQSYGTSTKTGAKATEAETKQAAINAIKSNLNAVKGADGKVNPVDYAAAVSYAVQVGYTGDQAQLLFDQYRPKEYVLPAKQSTTGGFEGL